MNGLIRRWRETSLQIHDIHDSRLKVALAVFFGAALCGGYTPQNNLDSTFVPLFSIFDEQIDYQISFALRVALIALAALIPNNLVIVFLVGILALLTWINQYSQAGAFLISSFFSAIFFISLAPLFTLKKAANDEETGSRQNQITSAAAVIAGLPFLLASLHKLNSRYLSGYEFSKDGPFSIPLYSLGLNPADWPFAAAMPVFSIVFELATFFLLLTRPVLGIRLAMLTIAGFALYHPYALFVYAVYFPFALLIDHRWWESLKSNTYVLRLVGNFPFWFVVTTFVVAFRQTAAQAFLVAGPVALGLLVYHARFYLLDFLSNKHESAGVRFDKVALLKNKRLLWAPALMVASFIAFHLGAPGPLGYSMFSAQPKSRAKYKIELDNAAVCQWVQTEFRFVRVSEMTVSKPEDSKCSLRFPTRSGVDFIIRRLCKTHPSLEFSIKTNGSENIETGRCPASVQNEPSGHNELIESALAWRYATQKFDPTRKISDRDWQTLIDSLVKTPTAFGLQALKFIVIQDPALRKRLREVSWNQSMITDADKMIVIVARNRIDEADVKKYIERMIEVRGVSRESLQGYENLMLKSAVREMSDARSKDWNGRQAYIALGFLIETAALLRIDATPIEGFEPKAYDDLLKLTGTGWHSVLVATLGYRHSSDRRQYDKKVRFKTDDLVIRK